MATTSELLTSLQNDLDRTIIALELEEGTNFTDIADMAENGDISTGGGADLSEYFGSLKSGDIDQKTPPLTIKHVPTIPISGTSLAYTFKNWTYLETIDMLDTSNVTNMRETFRSVYNLTTLPAINTSKVTTMYYMCMQCRGLVTFPAIDTSNVTDMNSMFYGCSNLVNFPVLNLAKVTTFGSWFLMDCTKLSNDSLNNILLSLAGAVAYTGTKTLKYIFGDKSMASYYPTATIEGLSNYQDFIDAGWTIGW